MGHILLLEAIQDFKWYKLHLHPRKECCWGVPIKDAEAQPFSIKTIQDEKSLDATEYEISPIAGRSLLGGVCKIQTFFIHRCHLISTATDTTTSYWFRMIYYF